MTLFLENLVNRVKDELKREDITVLGKFSTNAFFKASNKLMLKSHAKIIYFVY